MPSLVYFNLFDDNGGVSQLEFDGTLTVTWDGDDLPMLNHILI